MWILKKKVGQSKRNSKKILILDVPAREYINRYFGENINDQFSLVQVE